MMRPVPTQGVDVVVRPLRRTAEGLGVYGQDWVLVVKQLRAAGVTADFEDPPASRRFQVQHSATTTVMETLALSITSSAVYDALKHVFLTLPRQLRLALEVERSEGQASELFGTVEEILAQLPPSDVESDAETETSRELVAHVIRSRAPAVEERAGRAEQMLAEAQGTLATDPALAESLARGSLASFASALNWAEETPLEEAMHLRMDAAGRWVRATFGCTLEQQGTTYYRSCPVSLAHNRWGLSIGGVAKRQCSICGDDFSDCEHVPGTRYMIEGGTSELGWCRVCGQTEQCEHIVGERYAAEPMSIVTEVDLDEVSIVPIPAQPDARPQKMSVELPDLSKALGPDFVAGMPVSCDQCLAECDGLRRLSPDALKGDK